MKNRSGSISNIKGKIIPNNKEDDKTISSKSDEEMFGKQTVSFLTPDAISWMNKRRPNASNMKKHVNPSRVLQLRAVFNGLDFDGSGELTLEELKEAVDFVSKNNDGGPPIFEDPEKMKQFFKDMDADGSGAIDFQEFLVGMTSTGDGEGSKDNQRMQEAFYKFATQHRRTQILNEVNDDDISDLSRYAQMKNLFEIKFFRDEVGECNTIEEKIKRAKEEAAAERKKLGEESYKMRNTERARTRAAKIALTFDSEYKNKSSVLSNLSILLEDSYKEEKGIEEIIARNRLIQRLKKFSLKNTGTFEPPLSILTSTEKIKGNARKEAMIIKYNGASVTKSSLPPISIKKQIEFRTQENMLHGHR